MKQWFKKNKWKVLLPLLAAAVLAAAFWYGSSAPGARGWQPSEQDIAPETQENSEITEPSATAGGPSEIMEPAGENTDSTEGQPSGVADDVTERTNNGSRNPGNRRKNTDTSDDFIDEGDKPRSPEPIKTVRDDSGIITELELSDNPSAI